MELLTFTLLRKPPKQKPYDEVFNLWITYYLLHYPIVKLEDVLQIIAYHYYYTTAATTTAAITIIIIRTSL